MVVGTVVLEISAVDGDKFESAFLDGPEVGDSDTAKSASSVGLSDGISGDAEGKPRKPRIADGEGLCSTLGKGDNPELDVGADEDPARSDGAYVGA